MALTYNEILIAREALGEHHWKLWMGDEGSNETSVAFTRHIGPINEIQLDSFLEYLRRWVSAKNQNSFKLSVTGSIAPDIDGHYIDSGESSHGHAVYIREDGTYKFSVARSEETGAFFWQLIRVSSDKVIWISSGGSVVEVDTVDDLDAFDYFTVTDAGVVVPLNLGDEAASLSAVVWTPVVAGFVSPSDDLEIYDSFEISDEGVIEPVTGALSVNCEVPEHGIVYRSVTNPLVNNGKVRDGVWRITGTRPVRDHDGRYGVKGAWVILQDLALELNAATVYDAENTRWRQGAILAHKSGSRNVTLELPYIDPSAVYDLADDLNASTDEFNNSIYTVNGNLLSGKWFHVMAVADIDKASGYGIIRWFLRNHDNEDFRFVYQRSDTELVLEFFKLNMVIDGGTDSFRTTYYFTSTDFYVSVDGTNYTAKNGEAETGIMPDDAARLDSQVDGRTILEYSPRPDEKQGTVNLHLTLVFKNAVSYTGGDDGEGGTFPVFSFGEADIEEIVFKGSYRGLDLPSNLQILGVVDDGGRRKTVTRITNERIVNGQFEYDLWETIYTAPIHVTELEPDEWFYQGSAALTEREKSVFYKGVVDELGWSGWQPGDYNTRGAKPNVHVIELATKRPKNVLRLRKYFVRRPTDDDIFAANISKLEAENNDPTRITTDEVRQMGKHLYCIERIIVTLGVITHDPDAIVDADMAVWQAAGPLTRTTI